MRTYKELKEFVEKQGCGFVCEPITHEYEYFNPFECKIVKATSITGYNFGINNPACKNGKSEWQWYWFESIGEGLKDETNFYFEKRYSQVNGKLYKGWQERLRINNIISKAIEK